MISTRPWQRLPKAKSEMSSKKSSAEIIKRIASLAELLDTLKAKGWPQEQIEDVIGLLVKLGQEK